MMKVKGVIEDAKKQIEKHHGSGAWLNKAVQFNQGFQLDEEQRNRLIPIFEDLGIADRKENRINFEVLMGNLFERGYKRAVFVSLQPKDWRKRNYKRAGEATIRIINLLHKKGYLNMNKGYQKNKKSRYTRIWPSEKLLQYFRELPSGVIYEPVTLVELKDENGKLKDYKDTAETYRIKTILERANRVNKQAEIRYRKDKLSGSLVAIFNRKFTLYGRLHTKGYRHYQSFSEEERAEITINGEPIVELDYSGLHPHLLYAQEGRQFLGDPYSMIIDDSRLRKFFKKALLALLNAKGKWAPKKPAPGQKQYWRSAETNAKAAITKLMFLDRYLPKKRCEDGLALTDTDRAKIKDSRTAREVLEDAGLIRAQSIIEAFQTTHPRIAHYFCADADNGLRIMNKDARIALDIVNHFAKQEIPILAIHDSFIVQERYRDELHRTMKKMYAKHTGGFRIPIK